MPSTCWGRIELRLATNLQSDFKEAQAKNFSQQKRSSEARKQRKLVLFEQKGEKK
jgi:hypothetical protein